MHKVNFYFTHEIYALNICLKFHFKSVLLETYKTIFSKVFVFNQQTLSTYLDTIVTLRKINIRHIQETFPKLWNDNIFIPFIIKEIFKNKKAQIILLS